MTANDLRVPISLLAAVGFFMAALMYDRGRDSSAGRLSEPSVVELPEARLFFGIPNSVFGVGYYLLALLTAVVDSTLLAKVTAAVSAVALLTSIYLAIRLLVRRQACTRCWTAHAVNALLCPLLIGVALLSP